MRIKGIWCLFFFVLCVYAQQSFESIWVERNLPDTTWFNWDDALHHAAKNKKPIMLLITRNWCKACIDLKKSLIQEKHFLSIAKEFNLVNIELDTEEKMVPNLQIYSGDYIPRVFFAEPTGEIRKDVHCPGREDTPYKYFYATASELIHQMEMIADEANNKK